MFFGSVESQYLVGSSSPSGHSISSHSLARFSACWWLDATLTRTRANREDSHSLVPSRHLIVRHAFARSPSPPSLTQIALAASRRPFLRALAGRVARNLAPERQPNAPLAGKARAVGCPPPGSGRTARPAPPPPPAPGPPPPRRTTLPARKNAATTDAAPPFAPAP